MKRAVAAQKAVGGAVAKRSVANANAPRTRLPFLRNVAQNARRSPDTYRTATPFTSYPPHVSGQQQKKPTSHVLYKDPQCIIVNDAYPKSRLHCLVIPLDLSLDSLSALRPNHVPLLQHLMEVAEQYVQFTREDAASNEAGIQALSFMTGFHSLPSLPQLHMHLISRDLDGPCMKTKKHYNSFATPFFLPADQVVNDLRKNGCVTLNRNVEELNRFEHEEPRCLWCGLNPGGFQQLRVHLRTCKGNRAYVASSTAPVQQ
ncbi:Scavenger mRNA decapping enzyme C-term binding, putative [Trypanosoma equiperdum]|uniref:HIT domain-containing protein n=2 Tax=Trypanozoon TaxID=39700 RepID=Q57WA7_TRYB2|nr:hypothetical protein, conserved [Trypanosoma brucei brucei TREU927]AAX70124.1 hypothetical protein, conserved [Trypanosoma brucei]AAZ10404.1 hypothetical protein, conserved [Trypanosoma brucei brucei TREU927]SCU66071.1 Scavenger mRNA decapping enzyme C-term binding, putative [Trypanosoma equiperdum]